jgi:hypothetical protein
MLDNKTKPSCAFVSYHLSSSSSANGFVLANKITSKQNASGAGEVSKFTTFKLISISYFPHFSSAAGRLV